MDNKLHRHLVVAALLAFATQAAHGAATLINSSEGCFPQQISLTGAPLSATGQCHRVGTGGIGTAVADLGTGELGVLATTNGFGNAAATATFSTNVFLLPNQVVPLTVAMHLTGSITGGLSPINEILFFATIQNFGSFGIAGHDSLPDFEITPTGQSGVGNYVDAVVSATGSMLRDDLDITLTYSRVWNVGASGQTVPIGGTILAQVVPAVAGTAMTADFLHTGSVSFSVPPGTMFTSEGFLQATPAVSEPSTLLLLGAGLAMLVQASAGCGRRRSNK
jgi:hypothetical protein